MCRIPMREVPPPGRTEGAHGPQRMPDPAPCLAWRPTILAVATARRLLLLAAALFDLRPGVAQGDRPVEDERPLRGVDRLDAEIAQALELVPRAGNRVGQGRLELDPGERLQRIQV